MHELFAFADPDVRGVSHIEYKLSRSNDDLEPKPEQGEPELGWEACRGHF